MNKLKHVGLNAPQDERSANIIDNFNKFCNHLLENGIPLSTVNAIRAEVSKFTSQGQDPKFGIVDRGIVVGSTLFELNFAKDQEYERGLGFVATATAAATAGKKLLDMLPKDFMGNTFGAIFANGFDLSCWNASYSESKAQEALSKDLPFFINDYSGLGKNPTTATLDKFLNGIGGYISDSIHGQLSKFAKCTRKGYALRQKGAEEARDKVLETLKSSGFKLVPTGSRNGHVNTKIPSLTDKQYRWGDKYGSEYAYTYDTYRLEGGGSAPALETGNQNNDGSYQETVTGDSNYQPTGNTTGDGSNGSGNGSGNGSNSGKSSSNTGIIVAGVGLAALPFLLPMMKKSPVTAKKTSTKKKSK